MRNDFAVFILSHGRAKKVVTLGALKAYNYTGKIYIICDNEDDQIDEYKQLSGCEVIIFDKAKEMERTDTIDNFHKHGAVVYARNVCHDIAKDLGLTYFLVLDDDYGAFRFRYVNEVGAFSSIRLQNFDEIVDEMIDFLEVSGALTVALAQSGDYIGGSGSRVFREKLTRKAMNSFFCKTDRPFKFIGTINEDVNAYVGLGSRGKLFFTIGNISLNQEDTQQNSGGLTDLYLDLGTYVKSFYTVICNPSCVRVRLMGDNHYRLHHMIKWDNAVPKILNAKYKKV